MTMKYTYIYLAATFLYGCATSTGIVAAGNGEFFVSKQGGASMNWSGGAIKAELLRLADAHCRDAGQALVVVAERSIDATLYNYPSAELRFRCR